MGRAKGEGVCSKLLTQYYCQQNLALTVLLCIGSFNAAKLGCASLVLPTEVQSVQEVVQQI